MTDEKSQTGVNSEDVKHSVDLPTGGSSFRRFFAFAGPAILVSVGYMDPGNWGTDLAGGSQFGYALLWVILASNLIAQFLQVLCARLGLVTGMDLAEACRATYKKPAAFALWILAELAIIATDLAEVIGSAVALNLLFGMPLWLGVIITGLDVLLLLAFMKFGFRKIEAIVGVMVFSIFICFGYQLWMAQPNVPAMLQGLKPTMPGGEALAISLGILGATVMPHNLYLHSSVVQSRRLEAGIKSVREAVKFNTIDTIGALSMAFFVNAAILIMAAAVFHSRGIAVEELEQGHELLKTLLGGGAATAFAVALLASGQSSTITCTLAGQVVMEGFVKFKLAPWKRRLVTRLIAILPARVIILANGGKDTVKMLVASQVILSLQLPFAIFPLIQVTSNRAKMGEFVSAAYVRWIGFAIAIVISGLNIYFIGTEFGWLWVGLVGALVAGFVVYVNQWKEHAPKVEQ